MDDSLGEAADAVADVFSAYSDMKGRARHYLKTPALPPEFRDKYAWPTHAPDNRGWTPRALLDLLAQLFKKRRKTPGDRRTFFKRHATCKCMFAEVRAAEPGISN